MAQLWYNDGTGVRLAKELYYNDGGGVRTIKEAWYNDGTGVRKVYASGGIVSPFTAWNPFGDSTPGVSSYAQLTFQSNGVVVSGTSVNNLSTPGSANWSAPTTTAIGAGFWIRATVTVGTITTGTTGAWLSLAGNQTWTKGPATTGNASATLTFEIASDAGGATIVLTSTGNVIQYTHT